MSDYKKNPAKIAKSALIVGYMTWVARLLGPW